MPRLGDVGELGLLAELERRGLVHGIEHDAAHLAGGVVATQDALVQDVHFRLDWTSWRDLGYKAAAVNLSDLAASGAEPEGLIVSLGLPAETELDRVVELYEGLVEPGVPVLGGDTTAAGRVYLSVTAIGRSERVPGRAGALAGDLLVVTGPLGGSGAGFAALQEGRESEHVAAHLRPPLRLEEGRRLAHVAHAMLDVSDGLAADAARIAERSGCRLVIELERVPLAADLGMLGFGEDYELLAATPDPLDFAVIGRCEEGAGVVLTLAGELAELGGWEHFRR
ncbi:MAG: thiamine-phosphate kinase [Gaiellaceae bacterium]